MSDEDPDRRIYIGELAQLIDRRVNTIRGWERSGRLPAELCSHRSQETAYYSWRYWTPKQVSQFVKWMHSERLYPGAGLANFEPTPEQIEQMLGHLRRRKAAA